MPVDHRGGTVSYSTTGWEMYGWKRKMILPVEEEDVWSDVYLRSSLCEWLATHEWIVSWLTLLCGTMMR